MEKMVDGNGQPILSRRERLAACVASPLDPPDNAGPVELATAAAKDARWRLAIADALISRVYDSPVDNGQEARTTESRR